MFVVRYDEAALEELAAIRQYDRRRVVDEVERQLPSDAANESRSRKVLRPVGTAAPSESRAWQLRVGAFRVFYDVDIGRAEVIVRAVRRKGRKRTEEIL